MIARATAKDPADRHPDVAAFMYELRDADGHARHGQAASRRRARRPRRARASAASTTTA